MNERIVEYINILGGFCGKRDVSQLSPEELKKTYGIDQADVMVLFGGSILCGGDVLAQAMQSHAAKKYVIAGGAGHTTEALRIRVHQEFPDIETAGLPEARVFASYLKARYGLEADLLECCSTNCGNNITYLLDLLQANVIMKDGKPAYDTEIFGMWDIDRYLTLLMGEIPRLTDGPEGYGPLGKNYIAHVDIPDSVAAAFDELQHTCRGMVRQANPLYASRD